MPDVSVRISPKEPFAFGETQSAGPDEVRPPIFRFEPGGIPRPAERHEIARASKAHGGWQSIRTEPKIDDGRAKQLAVLVLVIAIERPTLDLNLSSALRRDVVDRSHVAAPMRSSPRNTSSGTDQPRPNGRELTRCAPGSRDIACAQPDDAAPGRVP